MLSVRRRVPRLVWVALVVLATGLVPALGVPLILSYPRGDRPGGYPVATVAAGEETHAATPTGPLATVLTAPPALTAPPTLSGSSGPVVPAAGGQEPAVTNPEATEPSATQPAPAAVGDPPTSAAPSPSPSPPSLLLSLEAEAGSLVQLLNALIVNVTGASGGKAVRFSGPGAQVRFQSVAVPSTQPYWVTVWYAPGGTASVTIQGNNGPVAVTLPAGTGCCASVTVQVPITPGGQLTIRLVSSNGAHPAIDGVVVQA